jgi:peptidoglycan-associated lipoprotein
MITERAGLLCLALFATACAPKHPTTAPAPPANQNVFVLLPESDGASSGIVVRNQAGAQELAVPYQAVRVDRNDVAPSAPFILDQPEVTRVFGPAIDVLPVPEVQFILHFDEGRDVLNADSAAMIPSILNAIRERHSTDITVTGHTDTTADAQFNYQLGLRRAERVVEILKGQGVNPSDIFSSSHGDSDLLVKTARGVAEAQNRRVEVIVR